MVGALIGATAVVSLVSTLGTPLIPTIAFEQNITLETAQWMLTITVLVGTVATPVVGRLGDGARRVDILSATIATVLVGSVVAATAGGFEQMLVGRGMMGFGWAAIPVAIGIAREHLHGAHLRATAGTLAIVVAVASGLGFPMTSLIVELVGVSAAFWTGAAWCALSLAGVLAFVPRSPRSTAQVRLDVPGAALLAIGLGALLLAISKGASWGWASTPVLCLLAGAAAVLAVWTWVELRHDEPLVDLRLICQRALIGANVVAFGGGISAYVGMTVSNRLAQAPSNAPGGLGATIFATGVMLMPLSLGSLVAQPLVRASLKRHGFRLALPGAALVLAVASFGLAVFHGHLVAIAVGIGLLGIGVGAGFAASPVLIIASVPHVRTASATSVNQVLRMIGGGMGSALGATALTAATPAGAVYPLESGYVTAFALCGTIAAVTAALAFLLLPRLTAPPGEADPGQDAAPL